ncbi:MAG: hypothetical protein COA41_00330 [Sphingopyxis sp.]|nr:MAG: hypothetical protein COA41_00330 [Sphingopyxis sp.]
MDMNFPHQNRKRVASEEGSDGPAHIGDHQALLQHAIARQVSSQSARDFDLARRGKGGNKEAVRSSIEDRMAFFAGRLSNERSGHTDQLLFKSGCFRPDLAQREIDKMDNS